MIKRLFILLMPLMGFAFDLGDLQELSAQVHTQTLIEDEVVSSASGQLDARQDVGMRWESGRDVLFINAEGLWRYQPHLNQVVHYQQIPQQFNAIKWLLDDSYDWSRQYRVTKEGNRISLVSFNNQERITINYKGTKIERVVWQNQDEKMIMDFSRFSNRTQLPNSKLRPQLPENTDIINVGEKNE